ncbi:MAG: phage holin, lambda family [Pyrinomonadaceae bacterium]
MPRMPDNPNNWLQAFMAMPGELQALLAAILTATIRVVYDRSEKSWQRIGLEGLLCGCISVGLYSGADYLGLPSSIGVFIGSSIGFIGVIQFRVFAFRLIGKKIGD